MKLSFLLCLCCTFAYARPPLYEPSIAPDRAEVAFVSGGDIWTVPLAGGEARLLVSHPATESRPVYSPDGKRLAFTSTRTGNGDVYVVDLPSGEVRRLTFTDSLERVDAWSPDGQYVLFTTAHADIAAMNDVFRVAATGGTPMPVTGDRYASEYFAAPAPDGKTLAFTARGIVAAQWWRNGHSHLDESEIWLLRDGKYQPVTERGAKSAWPMWTPDGKRLFFMSDRSGSENIWETAIGGTPRQVTKLTTGRVLWPSISRDGKTIVFERDFGLWRLDTGSGKAMAIDVTLRGAPASAGMSRTTMSTGFRDLALSPDGRKVVFAARGDLYAASVKDGGPAIRLTDTPALEANPVWAPDSRRVAYTSDRNGSNQVFIYDFGSNAEVQLTRSAAIDSSPWWSPDGKQIAFLRAGRSLMLIEVAGGTEREVAKGYFGLPPLEPARPVVFSPDGKWVAYLSSGDRGFRNVSVVPVAGGDPIRASYLPNAGSNSISWSPDGKYILFDTGQRTESGRVARIDLVPRAPRFREDQFREMFEQRVPPPSKEVRIQNAGIRERVTTIPAGVDVEWHTISPDGKWLLAIAEAAGQRNLWLYPLDELAPGPATPKQLTSTAGSKSDPWFTPDSKEVCFLESGRIQVINVDTRVTRPVAVTADVDLDFAKDKQEVFRQAWGYLNEHFYDEKFHGADWAGVRERVQGFVGSSRTPDELRRVLSLAIGELNASHTGISGPPLSVRSGCLGVRFDPATYEASGELKIAEIIRSGSADVAGLKRGQVLQAVNGTKLNRGMNLDELLEHYAGKRVVLMVDGADVAVSPVTLTQEKALLYRHWVEGRRDYVHRISKGRLGYVHMVDMSAGSLDQLYLDLDAENVGREGVVVDIRNNNGGFVNVYALDVLARRPFLNMTVRGMPTAPARSLLGQRALEKPTILVINQHSLSDAEDFTEGYRSLGLGKIVGEPTAGWIIYTANTELIDGSILRLPRVRITDVKGENMERNPRRVDIPVGRPIGESYTTVDSQLDVAVHELLKQLKP